MSRRGSRNEGAGGKGRAGMNKRTPLKEEEKSQIVLEMLKQVIFTYTCASENSTIYNIQIFYISEPQTNFGGGGKTTKTERPQWWGH